MADIKTKEERSLNMAAIRSKDTKPEMLVRRFLHAAGYRYRLHDRKLPGCPDLVFPNLHTVIFIHGCFWHGHENCNYFRLPKSNIEFWEQKIKNNVARDVRNENELKSLGWRVIRVWECDIRKVAGGEEYLQGLYDTITNPNPADYDTNYETTPLAAEPENIYGQND